MPPLCLGFLVRGQVLRQKQNHSGEQALSGVIEEGVLSVLRGISIRIDDGLSEDLGILLRLGAGGNVFRILPADIHVVIDESQQIVSV